MPSRASVSPSSQVRTPGFWARSGSRIAKAVVEVLEERRLLSSTSGAVDPAYGAHGTATLAVTNSLTVAAATLDANGKLLVAGNVSTANAGDDFAIARFNADGTPDTSFGNGGVVTTDFTGGDDDIQRILVEPNGKILAAGTSGSDFALAQYNANGSLDTTFGNGGLITTSIGSSAQIQGIALEADGTIIAAGTSDRDIAVAAYNPGGSLDANFGAGGIVTTAAPASQGSDATLDANAGVAILANSTILVVGDETDDSGGSAAFAYYDPNGTLNALDLGAELSSSPSLSDFVPLPNGQVLAIGSTDNSTFALSRFNADASLDTTFGTNGSATDLLNTATNVVVQPNGQILVAGKPENGNGSAIARFNADGSDNLTFGSDGIVVSPNTSDGVVALQADGNIIAAGDGNSTTSAFVATRYLANVGVTPPTVAFSASDLTTTGQNTIALDVTYASAAGVDQSTLADSNLVVTGPTGSTSPVSFDSATINADGSVTAIYDVQKDASSHNFNSADDGPYAVSLESGEVLDNNGVAAPAGQIGTFNINIIPPPGGIVPPAGTLAPTTITAPATTDATFDVTYKGTVAIDETTIDDSNVTVTAPDGTAMDVTYVQATDNADGSVTAQYSFAKDDHSEFTVADNGAYAVATNSGEVTDIEGTPVTAGTIGSVTLHVTPPPAGAVAPTATLQAPDLTDSYTQTLTVTYAGPAAIAQNTLDDNDILVTGPNNFSQTASFSSATTNADGSVTAQYTISVYAGGSFTATPITTTPITTTPISTNGVTTAANIRSAIATPADTTLSPIDVVAGGTSSSSGGTTTTTPGVNPSNGTYTVSIQSNQVSDVRGVSVAAATLGTFQVNLPANLPSPVIFTTSNGSASTPSSPTARHSASGSSSTSSALTAALSHRLHLHHLHRLHLDHILRERALRRHEHKAEP